MVVRLLMVTKCRELRVEDREILPSSLVMCDDVTESMTHPPRWRARLVRATISADLSQVHDDEAGGAVC
jgi:hypothetical protein